uniref:Uncharacterized protein n=1 Tax=Romanomermis culicivorax TaxID=13658 RepID=A0A915IXU0_ROMCU
MSKIFSFVFAFFRVVSGFLSVENPPIFPGEERYFKNLRQITFSGVNSEAYFSFDGSQITFQSTDYGFGCDQIFRFKNVTKDDMSSKRPQLISTGLGRTTCSYFLPDDQKILYASTHAKSPLCPLPTCSPQVTSKNATLKQLCDSLPYVWDIYPTYDIYVTSLDAVIQKRLTFEDGYDAEGTVSPKGDLIVYTSMASGDLDLWSMRLDGTHKRRITSRLGYEGGAFFSPDGRKLIFRAWEPKSRSEIDQYKKLLSFAFTNGIEAWNLDSSDGEPQIRQITNLGGSNWAPFYFQDNCRVIFSSNFKDPALLNFQLYAVDTCGPDLNLRQITNGSSFNSFPMFSPPDGKYLIFASTRNSSSFDMSSPKSFASKNTGFNLFLAEWKDDAFQNRISFVYANIRIFSNAMLIVFIIFSIFSILSFYRFKYANNAFKKLQI